MVPRLPGMGTFTVAEKAPALVKRFEADCVTG
jgi:hypothetical protein